MINKVYVYWFDKENSIFENKTLIGEIQKKFKLINDFEIIYNEKGKPFLKNYPKFNISITHTDFDTFFAISKNNIGIDAEIFDKKNIAYDQTIIENYYPIAEQNYLKTENTPKKFYHLWTRKEALIKLTSDKLNEKILKTNVIPDNILYLEKQIIFKTIIVEKNIILSTAIYKKFLNNKIEIILQKL